jgi:predicted Zn-dependent peptidase
MQRTSVDGVLTLVRQGPAPLSATLTFGCGARDESFRTLGITHLIEHLAMSTLARLHHEHNASVDLETTRFTASGRPDQVAAFLTAVCAALSDLPLERMEREAGVLAAEGSSPVDREAAFALHQRYGHQGVGLAPCAGPGYDRLTAAAVRHHAATYFTRANAVLQLTGPVPDGLRLPLPDGPRPQRAPHTPRHGASWDDAPIDGAALTFSAPVDSPAGVLGNALFAQRLERLARHTRGISYSVGGAHVLRDDRLKDTVIWLDARPGHGEEVATLLWNETARMAREPATESEIKDEIEGFREAYQDPRYVGAELDLAARAELFGLPYRDGDARLRALDSVTPREIAEHFAQALAGATLTVADGIQPNLDTLDGTRLERRGYWRNGDLPEGKTFRAPLLARVAHREARKARLVLTPTEIAELDTDADVHEIDFDHVVGMERNGEDRTLFGASGCTITVSADLYKGADRIVAFLDTAVPAELAYDISDLRPKDPEAR